MEQHDDHIWVVVLGESWAIEGIRHKEDSTVFYLWRGYYPNIERSSAELKNWDWTSYCEAAVAVLYEHYGAFGKT
jgi:hypothetical protein